MASFGKENELNLKFWRMRAAGRGTVRRAFRAMALAFAAAYSVPAVLMVPLSVEELAEEAEWIVQGQVLKRSTQRDDSGRIYTRIELDVKEVWKGGLQGGRFVLVHGGGILGEERSVVSGQAEFQIGEEVVAFLVGNERGEGVTLGLAQGKFHVWEEAGVKRVRNLFHGHPPSAAPHAAASHDPGDKIISGALTLDELKGRVQTRASKGGPSSK
jgi:hypothetical protein